jgi:hypothetical protein
MQWALTVETWMLSNNVVMHILILYIMIEMSYYLGIVQHLSLNYYLIWKFNACMSLICLSISACNRSGTLLLVPCYYTKSPRHFSALMFLYITEMLWNQHIGYTYLYLGCSSKIFWIERKNRWALRFLVKPLASGTAKQCRAFRRQDSLLLL